jgi:hypothetical protein
MMRAFPMTRFVAATVWLAMRGFWVAPWWGKVGMVVAAIVWFGLT